MKIREEESEDRRSKRTKGQRKKMKEKRSDWERNMNIEE